MAARFHQPIWIQRIEHRHEHERPGSADSGDLTYSDGKVRVLKNPQRQYNVEAGIGKRQALCQPNPDFDICIVQPRGRLIHHRSRMVQPSDLEVPALILAAGRSRHGQRILGNHSH